MAGATLSATVSLDLSRENLADLLTNYQPGDGRVASSHRILQDSQRAE